MPRLFTFAVTAVVLAAVAGVSGCSGPGGSAPSTGGSVDAIGDAGDTTSPAQTGVRPVPTDSVPVPVAATPTGALPTSVPPAVAAMMTCLDGNWSAPVSREFTALGISDRTNGAVRSGTGLLRLTLGRDQSFTFTYDQVTLSMAAGSALVNGPVTGTWSLSANTLRTTLIANQTKVDVKLGPFTLGAPSAVASAVETLPPTDVMVGCTADKLTMQLSSADGGGIVTFDRA